jgi:hypothetical protein
VNQGSQFDCSCCVDDGGGGDPTTCDCNLCAARPCLNERTLNATVNGHTVAAVYRGATSGLGLINFFGNEIAGYGQGDCTVEEAEVIADYACVFDVNFVDGDLAYNFPIVLYRLGGVVRARTAGQIVDSSVLTGLSTYMHTDVGLGLSSTIDCNTLSVPLSVDRCSGYTGNPGSVSVSLFVV